VTSPIVTSAPVLEPYELLRDRPIEHRIHPRARAEA
jgi:hypothetical protein